MSYCYLLIHLYENETGDYHVIISPGYIVHADSTWSDLTNNITDQHRGQHE